MKYPQQDQLWSFKFREIARPGVKRDEMQPILMVKQSIFINLAPKKDVCVKFKRILVCLLFMDTMVVQ